MAAERDYRERLTDTIIDMLEKGTAPWQKPWNPAENGSHRLPYNPTTDKPYRGANSLYLSAIAIESGYDDPRWCTYKQAQEQGWQVRKGEKSSLVEYWKFTDERQKVDGNGKPVLDAQGLPVKEVVQLERPKVFRAAVFNAAQMDNVPELAKTPMQYEWVPEQRAEAILRASDARLFHDQNDRAFYSVSRDEIHLPGRDQFKDTAAYYSTALHELGHWTGHESRLGRDLGNSFGSIEYAKEELRAELSSYFMAERLGIPHNPGQHAAYVGSWVKVLQDDKHEIFRAAKEAEKITEYVLALDRQRELSQDQGHAQAVDRRAADQGERAYLNVPFSEKDKAKELGAKWDKPAKAWYVPAGVDQTPFAQWAGKPAQGHQMTAVAAEKAWLAVPFNEKDEARAAGARWDKDSKAWYAPEGADMAKLERWVPNQEAATRSNSRVDPQAEFLKALERAGLQVEGLPEMDGKMHRVPVVDGRAGNLDGAYVGHLDGRPSGFIQNYKTGTKENWTLEGVELSATEKAELAAQAQVVKAQRAAEVASQHASVASKSLEKWNRLPDAPPAGQENAYLARKQVPALGVKFDGDKLVVPVRDLDGKVWSLQSIPPGEGLPKMFEKGGRKSGNMHVIGELKAGQDILVAEGYATGASLHVATGKAVVVAFDSGNLDRVVDALKNRYPTSPIFIMGDNDKHQQQNIGVEKALAAAEKHQVGVAFPKFSIEGKLSDFNDLHQKEGLQTVKDQVTTAISYSMDKSREEAVALAKSQLGEATKVVEPGRNTRHTGKVLANTPYHSAQASAGDAVIHEKRKLDKLPTPGNVVTMQYQNGAAKVSDRTIEKQQEQFQAVTRI